MDSMKSCVSSLGAAESIATKGEFQEDASTVAPMEEGDEVWKRLSKAGELNEVQKVPEQRHSHGTPVPEKDVKRARPNVTTHADAPMKQDRIGSCSSQEPDDGDVDWSVASSLASSPSPTPRNTRRENNSKKKSRMISSQNESACPKNGEDDLRDRVFSPSSDDVTSNMKARQPQKVCRVCGGKAVGFNFTVVTCGSCKAFFRRNAQNLKVFRCSRQDNCNITISTRRSCQKCRLRKCFEVGMKHKYILIEEQKGEQHLVQRRAVNKVRYWQAKEDSIENFAQNDTEIDQDHKPANGSALSKAAEPVLEPKSACAKLDLTVNATATLNVQPRQDSSESSAVAVAGAKKVHTSQTATPAATSITSSISTASPNSNDDNVEIIIHMPKSALLNILSRRNDQASQATLLGQAVMAKVKAAAIDASTSIGPSSSVKIFSLPTSIRPEGSTEESVAPSQTQDCEMNKRVPQDQSLHVKHLQIRKESSELIASSPISSLGFQSVSRVDQSTAVAPTSTSMELDLTALADLIDQNWDMPVLSRSSVYLQLKFVKLEELLVAGLQWSYSDVHAPRLTGVSELDLTVEDKYHLVNYGARNFILQYNNVTAFKNLPPQDQQVLFKKSFLALIVLRSLTEYDQDHDRLNISYPGADYVDFRVTNRFKGGLHEHMKALFTSFPAKWRNNYSLISILSALALFNPDRPHISNKAAVEAERRVYLQLLRDYLENTCGEDEALSWYNSFVEYIKVFPVWVENHLPKFVCDFDSETMDLMMFDMFGPA